jgi:hypothetical protein
MSLNCIKKTATLKRLGKDNSIKESAADNINSSSPLLQLPTEVRFSIYKHAFSRSPIEHLKALHFGPSANSASGLMLACRQTRNEARGLYHQDAVISLWPHWPQDALPFDSAKSNYKPMLLSWRKSRNGIAIEQNPDRIHQLSLLFTLTRATRTTCENFIETDLLRNAKLKIKDIHLRICICGALKWLHETPLNIMSFCMALETFAYNFPTLERIHILYCGLRWPTWIGAEGDVPFPQTALSVHEMRMFSGANWSINRVGGKKRSWGPSVGRDPTQVQPTAGLDQDSSEDPCKLRTVMSWNHTQAHPGQVTQQVPWKERSVSIDYYDSWSVLGERCVRNKPSQQSEYKRRF